MLRGDPPGRRRYREAGSRLDRPGRLPQGNGACTHVPGPDVGEIRYGVPAGILASTYCAPALLLDEIGRERDLQRQGAQQAEARAERAVELAQERVVPAHERL